MELWIGALNLGFLYAFMTMGIFITFRIHDFPDITVDGSFTSGAAAAAVLLSAGVHPLPALCASFCIGCCAGSITALIHTRFNVNGLLAGILVMTGLYSINLHIMGRSNIPLLNQATFITFLERINPGLPAEARLCLFLLVLMAVFWLGVSLFFKTDTGIAMRITGNNPVMAAANGIHVERMTVFGVALANGLVGVSGGLVAQYQGFADIGMGIGTIVVGLAGVIIGESLLKARSMFAKILCVIIGSVIFRLMIAVALFAGMNPIDLKLLTAVFVFLTLIVSKALTGSETAKHAVLAGLGRLLTPQRLVPALVLVCALGAAAVVAYRQTATTEYPAKKTKIGFIQLVDHGLLNITRDAFIAEMQRLGYGEGTCTIILKNANGDMPTVNTILDSFVQQDVDIVVPVSTPCTQAAVNKITDRPVVFATVANPFIIGAGTSENDHLPNVTGVYGWVPMDETIDMVRTVLPGPLKVGAVWDPAHANSVFNMENLKKAVEAQDGLSFFGATITGSSEVYQAAQSLVQRGIDVFVLSPDNIVYSAFESVVKAARSRHIPIFMSDVERLGDGALGVLGYDYTASGIQAARLVHRILNGEDPAGIPIERYKKRTIGFNLNVARQLGIDLPRELLAKATRVVGGANRKPAAGVSDKKSSATQRRLVLFLFSEHSIIHQAEKGILDELRQSGIIDRYNITIDTKNAQNEFFLAQSIVQDIVRSRYDYIITLSTPALQVTAQGNKTIPHIFGAVTDPFRMGVAEGPEKHLPQLTGIATLQPVEATIQVMREVFPDARCIGMVWNPAEACSEACTLEAREAAARYGFELLEATVSSTAEVLEAVKSLSARRIDCFLTAGDNTVLMALESIADIMTQHKIPYFTNGPSDVERGSFISIGADYYEVGRRTARVAARVIRGEKPADIPIENCVPEKMYVNRGLARRYGITIPEAVLERAANVYD